MNDIHISGHLVTWLERANHTAADIGLRRRSSARSESPRLRARCRRHLHGGPSSRRSRRPRCGGLCFFLFPLSLSQHVILYIQLRYHTHDSSHNFGFSRAIQRPTSEQKIHSPLTCMYSFHRIVCSKTWRNHVHGK